MLMLLSSTNGVKVYKITRHPRFEFKLTSILSKSYQKVNKLIDDANKYGREGWFRIHFEIQKEFEKQVKIEKWLGLR